MIAAKKERNRTQAALARQHLHDLIMCGSKNTDQGSSSEKRKKDRTRYDSGGRRRQPRDSDVGEGDTEAILDNIKRQLVDDLKIPITPSSVLVEVKFKYWGGYLFEAKMGDQLTPYVKQGKYVCLEGNVSRQHIAYPGQGRLQLDKSHLGCRSEEGRHFDPALGKQYRNEDSLPGYRKILSPHQPHRGDDTSGTSSSRQGLSAGT